MEDHEKTKKQLLDDITGLREAENALREREQRAALLLQAAQLGIHECDTEGRITYVNPSQERITGYTAEELLGTSIWDRTVPGPRKDELPALLKRLAREQPPPEPYFEKNLRKNGEVYDVRVDWNYKRDPQGRVIGFVSIITDVTEQKRAEAALRTAHDDLDRQVKLRTADLVTANKRLAIFRRFAEASGQGFGMADLEGYLTYVNPALSRLFGEETPEDAIGKHVSIYYREAYTRRRTEEVLPALSREGQWHGEEVIHSRCGRAISVLQSTFLIRDEHGNPLRLASAIADITARKAAEAALRQSRDELQAIYDGMTDGLLIADIETKRLVRANLLICRMLGYSDEELRSMSVKDLHPKEDLPHVLETFQALADRRMTSSGDLPVLRRNGTVFYADIASSPLLYNGRPSLIGFVRDVTERRQAGQALQERTAALEAYSAQLGQVNERLRKEEQHLRDLMELQERDRQLVGFEIHDGLAQLLAGAMMLLEVFRQRHEPVPEEAWQDFTKGVELLARSIGEARRLINGLRPPSLDVAGVVEAIADLVREVQARERLHVDLVGDVQFGRLPQQLENTIFRVVQESLMNACRHSRSETVRIELRQRGNRVAIEVRDWGVGFDPRDVRKGRFGLASIRERARVFGGQATIESRPGEGTRVRVELPLPETEARTDTAQRPPSGSAEA